MDNVSFLAFSTDESVLNRFLIMPGRSDIMHTNIPMKTKVALMLRGTPNGVRKVLYAPIPQASSEMAIASITKSIREQIIPQRIMSRNLLLSGFVNMIAATTSPVKMMMELREPNANVTSDIMVNRNLLLLNFFQILNVSS
jgi:hypothetical protein